MLVSGADSAVVWTGTSNAGTSVTGMSCNNWASNLFSDTGEFCFFDSRPAFWSDATGAFPCSNTSQAHLYCFDTSHTNPITIPSVSAHPAFISKTDFDPSTSIATAATLCQTETANATFPHP